MRVDYNVPIQNGQITSTKRIKSTLPTIRKIIEEGGKLFYFTPWRVKSEKDLTKIFKNCCWRISKWIRSRNNFVPVTRGEELEQAVESLQAGEVLLVENTRFEDLNNKAESKMIQNLENTELL